MIFTDFNHRKLNGESRSSQTCNGFIDTNYTVGGFHFFYFHMGRIEIFPSANCDTSRGQEVRFIEPSKIKQAML